MSAGDGDVGGRLVSQFIDGREDGVGPVSVDEIDEWLEVTASRVVGSTVLQFAPGSEQHQLRMVCTETVRRVADGDGHCGRSLSSPVRGDASVVGE
ncbi:hypothetical protein [Streptomyces acidicola]|uniref:hypothetical protein n=1 Tax=Streptomyces acidicola TaxID=2596892 RepID=UPI00341929BD